MVSVALSSGTVRQSSVAVKCFPRWGAEMQLLDYCFPWIIWNRKIYYTPLANILYVFMTFGGKNIWDFLL